MLRFVVLGQVPGTSVQINFYTFLFAVCILGTAILARYYWQTRRQKITKLVAILRVAL